MLSLFQVEKFIKTFVKGCKNVKSIKFEPIIQSESIIYEEEEEEEEEEEHEVRKEEVFKEVERELTDEEWEELL